MGSGLRVALRLPVCWRPARRDEDRHGVLNATLLRALAALDATPPREPGEEEERLEAKLDLTLAVLGQLLREQQALPPARDCLLGSDHLAWEEPAAPARVSHVPGGDAPGQASGTQEVREQEILVQLWLSTRLPLPVSLCCRPLPPDRDGWARAEILDAGQEAGDWLERTIFRLHRQQVQQHRRQR